MCCLTPEECPGSPGVPGGPGGPGILTAAIHTERWGYGQALPAILNIGVCV